MLFKKSQFQNKDPLQVNNKNITGGYFNKCTTQEEIRMLNIISHQEYAKQSHKETPVQLQQQPTVRRLEVWRGQRASVGTGHCGSSRYKVIQLC